jgi:hypothetical protein
MTNKKKGTYQIKNGDVVFATGVFLQRDTFEDDTFFDGATVNSDQTDDGESYFYIGDSDEE